MRRLLGVMLLLLCCSGVVWAEEQLDEVVVTATRTSTELGKIGGASVSVITAEDIEARHLTSVVDVLNTVPGLQISTTGGMGTTSKVFMRGADSKDTLLLIDGVIVNDPTDTNRGVDFSNITLDNVERIEVVRGAMSVLYGSNATAGVINIITKSGSEKLQGVIGGETGSYNTYKLYGGLSHSASIFDFNLFASHLTTDGYSLANSDNNRIDHANSQEKDGWENDTFSGKVTFDLCSSASLTATIRYIDAEMDLDEGFGAYALDSYTGTTEQHVDSERFFNKLNLHTVFNGGTIVSDVAYKYARQRRDSYDSDDKFDFGYLGVTEEWSWQGTWLVSEIDTLSAGINYVSESMDGYGIAGDEGDADTISYWLQNQLIVAGLDVVAGVRYDNHDQFGGKTTWRLAPAYHIEKFGTTLRASYATGFRSPSLYEMYSGFGNTSLDPEKSESWEVGLDQNFFADKLRCGVTYFNLTFENRIDWDDTIVIAGAPYLPAWGFVSGGYNQLDGDSSTEGLEFSAKYQIIDPLLLSLSYTYTDTEDPDGSRMVRRPLNKVHASISYTFSKVGNINLDGYWTGERDAISRAGDAHGNTVTSLDDYFLVNLAAHYDVNDMLRIYARIDNLFDEHYEEAWSYATPGQSFYVGAKLTF